MQNPLRIVLDKDVTLPLDIITNTANELHFKCEDIDIYISRCSNSGYVDKEGNRNDLDIKVNTINKVASKVNTIEDIDKNKILQINFRT